MISLIDFIINLFRSPASAAAFVADPEEAMRTAGLPPVNPAHLQAVAATAAPAGVVLGGGDPVVGLQRAVANHHSIASPFSPQTTYAPQTQADVASHNDTDWASHNNTDWASHNDTPVFSPDQHSGANSQQGGFNLGFGDITFGNKTSNTATDGAVISNGDLTGSVATGEDAVATGDDNDGDILTGDESVQGDDNEVHSGDVLTGAGSNVVIGDDNDVTDSGTTATGGGDIIQDNEGPVIGDVEAGGDAGPILIDDADTDTDTTTVVGGDVSGEGAFDMSDNSGQDNSDNRDYSENHEVSIDTDIDTTVQTDLSLI
ncbi:IniB N-terminal domain-containing protein [Mycolicibacterium sp.]|uniref:IniB N-terminal domain-containing protein n=1 Tax=Mycolicibacterium sp. TaxID=2320850 RepID=UPI003D096E44